MSNENDRVKSAMASARPIGNTPRVDPEDRLRRCADHPLNDEGNGFRFVDHYGRDCLFVQRLGWHVWNGKAWKIDDDAFAVRRLAGQVQFRIGEELPFVTATEDERKTLDDADAAQDELNTMETDNEPETMAKRRGLAKRVENGAAVRKAIGARKRSHRAHGVSSGNSHKQVNMLSEAAKLRATSVESLNADPYLINCRSGALRFNQKAAGDWSVERLPHDRSYLCSKMAEADYNEDATAPTFTAFLERIQPEPDRREFLQRWFGYTLLGLTTEQKLLFAHGDGRKGKSTLIDVIAQILADYATTVPIESLTGSEQRKGSDATPDLVRIPGARMVRASEPEQGQKMKEALVKALTGGEPVMVRRMHQEFIEVTPEFKLTISGNHRPEIRGGDDGIWRRVLLCPFDQQIPLDEVDPDLPAKLQAEIDGIFAWMVAGAVKWLTDGLKTPGDVMAASNEYRLESDPLREFLLGECVITGSESDWITSADVIDVFRLMQEETGDDPWTKRTVAKTLKDRSAKLKHPDTGATFWPHKRNGTVDYKGLAFGLDAASALARVIDRRSRL